MNKNIYFTLFYVLFFYSTFALRLRIRKKTLSAEKIKGKIFSIWTTKYIFYAYLIILFGSFIEYSITPRKINLFISISGVILYIIGIAGRQWAWKSLGKYWSVNIEIRENHDIIRKGPYKYMRHPNNLFHLTEVFAVTLVPNSFYTAAVFIIAYLPVIVIRSISEEKEMIKKIGPEYIKYKKETGGFFPVFKEGN
ncbi:MAG: methyltransferase family protein [Elusimicrobiota bacterium]